MMLYTKLIRLTPQCHAFSQFSMYLSDTNKLYRSTSTGFSFVCTTCFVWQLRGVRWPWHTVLLMWLPTITSGHYFRLMMVTCLERWQAVCMCISHEMNMQCSDGLMLNCVKYLPNTFDDELSLSTRLCMSIHAFYAVSHLQSLPSNSNNFIHSYTIPDHS